MDRGSLGFLSKAGFWRGYEIGLLFLCAGLVAWQLFLPPSLGVADNNDFPKLIGRYCLGDAGQHPLFEYVSFHYRVAPSYCWDSGLVTSAALPLQAARLISRVFRPAGGFDLRVLGAVYAFLFLAAFHALQRLARMAPPGRRLILPAVALLIFGGAAYVPWFNSFYFDTASYLALLWFGIAAYLLVFGPRIGMAGYFAAVALVVFFATSKSQHAPLALLMIPCFLFPFGRREFPARWARVTAAVAIAGSTAYMLASVPRFYTTAALYNALFYQALPREDHPAADLAALGIDHSMMSEVGKHRFQPDTRMEDPAVEAAFAARISVSKMAWFYLTHPRLSARVLAYALEEASLQRVRMKVGSREYRLGNYARSTGRGAESQSHFLTLWSDLKAASMGNRPAVYAGYAGALLLAVCILAMRRPAPQRPQAVLLAATLSAMTAASLLASMFDGVETGRHLFLFNALLDMAVCAGIALV